MRVSTETEREGHREKEKALQENESIIPMKERRGTQRLKC